MSFSQKRVWLVAYDISDPGRLARVHRFLRGRAAAVQYSVFAGPLNAAGVQAIVKGLCELIDFQEDDLRLYPLPERCEAAALGRCSFPEGVWLTDHRLLTLMRATAPASAAAPGERGELEQPFAADPDQFRKTQGMLPDSVADGRRYGGEAVRQDRRVPCAQRGAPAVAER
jgi:CRISPR-associated protein Cas2